MIVLLLVSFPWENFRPSGTLLPLDADVKDPRVEFGPLPQELTRESNSDNLTSTGSIGQTRPLALPDMLQARMGIQALSEGTRERLEHLLEPQ